MLSLRLAAASLIMVTAVRAELSWPGCAPLKPDEFKMVRLVGKSATNSPQVVDATLEEPVKLAFDLDAAGGTDVFWVERRGAVKKYSTTARAVTLLGKLTPATGNEDGLVGIALDPAFKTNRWMYLFYSSGPDFRVSRFTLNGNSLDMSSEAILLRIPSDRDKDHSGGAMVFDDYGDLWISVGDNSAGERGSSNSNDLRGSILRIRPTPDGKYTVPAGNWKETLEGSYSAADLQKVKPEIYVKGLRNAYTLAVDPVRRWLAWGDVGPDWYSSSDRAHPTEEHNLVKAPGFMGWPYFSGTNICNGGCAKNASAPTNTSSGNSGLTRLPPAVPAIHAYPRSAAMTGPIYRYDGDSPSPYKLPPHFHRKWILSDFRSRFIAATLDEEGTRITARDTVFQHLTTYAGSNNPNTNTVVEARQGPDGALYIINYNGWYNTVATTSIARFEYSGSCRPTEPKLERIPGTRAARPGRELPGVRVEGALVDISIPGPHSIELTDLSGRNILTRNAEGARRHSLPSSGHEGLRILRVRTSAGELTRPIYLP
jgi:glucose/arabinose dehydrogenase